MKATKGKIIFELGIMLTLIVTISGFASYKLLSFGVKQDTEITIEPLTEIDTTEYGDRWHVKDFMDGHTDFTYVEWKYFNFQSEDIKGFIGYLVYNPEDKLGIGFGRIAVRIYYNDQVYGVEGINFPITQVLYSDSSANVKIGKYNDIEVISEDHYLITGETEDVSWNLEYFNQTEPIEFGNTPVGVFKWEKMGYRIQCLKARVKGTISINTDSGLVNIPLDCIGYHDGNWGEWIIYNPAWTWGQFFCKDSSTGDEYSIFFAQILNKNVQFIGFAKDGEVYSTNKFLHSNSVHEVCIKENLKSLPRGKLEGYGDGFDFKIFIENTRVDPVILTLLDFLPGFIIYEQLCNVEVDLVLHDDKTGDRKMHLAGQGFKENTAVEKLF